MPLHIRGPYRQGAPTEKGPLQIRDPYRRCAISTDKGPIQTKNPYMIYTGKRLLQTRNPCKQGPLRYIQAKGTVQACRKYLKTTRAHSDKGLLQNEAVQTRGPYRHPTVNGSLHTKGPYRQGTARTRSPYRTRGPYSNSYKQIRAPIKRDPYMIYRQGPPIGKSLYTSKEGGNI